MFDHLLDDNIIMFFKTCVRMCRCFVTLTFCFFRFVNADKGNLKTEISHAAVCCRLTESLLKLTDSLFIVPPQLLTQLRELNEQQRHKLKENKPVSSELHHTSSCILHFSCILQNILSKSTPLGFHIKFGITFLFTGH